MDYTKFVEDKNLPEAKHCIPSHSLSFSVSVSMASFQVNMG